MSKKQYFAELSQRANALLNDEEFMNDRLLLYASVALKKSSPKDNNICGFDPKKLTSAAYYLQSAGISLLNKENDESRRYLLSAAELFEALASNCGAQDSWLDLIFNSAICYSLANQKADSVSMAEILEKRIKLGFSGDEAILTYRDFLYIGTLVLLRDTKKLSNVIKQQLQNLDNFQILTLDQLRKGHVGEQQLWELIAYQDFIQGVNAFVNFCLKEDKHDMALCFERLEKAEKNLADTGDIDHFQIVSGIFSVIKKMCVEKSSTLP